MAKKTNKTSHVLNLITNGNPAPEPEQTASVQQSVSPKPAESAPQTAVLASQAVEEGQAAFNSEMQPGLQGQSGAFVQAGQNQMVPQTASASQTVSAAGQLRSAGMVTAPVSEKKVVVVDDSETNRLSDEIRDQLIRHLEEEEQTKAQENAKIAESETQGLDPSVVEELLQSEESEEPEAAKQPSAESEVIQEVVQEPEPVSQTVEPKAEYSQSAPSSVSAPEAAKQSSAESEVIQEAAQEPVPASQPEEEPTYRMVNVMEQILKRQKLEQQMERYGVCTCSRCRADVEALALTKLPAKYIVVDKSTVAPMIGFYENRFRVNILTQIIRACIQVKDNPHHGDR